MMQIIASKYDIAPYWHEKFGDIMALFVDNFEGEVSIYNSDQQDVGTITSIERRGEDLWGDVRWVGGRPAAGYVRINWACGCGDRATVTSGYVSPWGPATEWPQDEEEDDLDEADPGDEKSPYL